MCAAWTNVRGFKWLACLVLAAGVYTLLYWFLAVPLLYSHLYGCCDAEWPGDWMAWFLGVAFAAWLGSSALILTLCWWCGRQREKKEEPQPMVCLGTLPSPGSVTTLQVNDVAPDATPIPSECPIPVNESRHFVQDEYPAPENKSSGEKTPREIFFKDMIEAASGSASSYFDFDPVSMMKKYGTSQEDRDDGNTFFVGSTAGEDNLTSEVLVTLNEKGLMAEEPAVLGRFHVLK